MIKKLQRKFVFISTMSLLIVMVFVMGTVNIVNILQLNQRANEVLQMLSENDGEFPDMFLREDTMVEPPDEQMELPDGQVGLPDEQQMTPPEGQMTPPEGQMTPPDNQGREPGRNHNRQIPNHMSEETPFETRYFIIRTNELFDIMEIDTSHIAAISSTEAESYAIKAIEKGKESGFADVYKYLIKETNNGYVLVFVDCRTQLQTAFSFLLVSILISFASVLVVYILIWIFSKRAIRPVVESMEKQKQFITDAGHELKTPISIISANTEVLELTSGKNEWTQSIRHQTSRLSGLVKDLLTLSKMDEETYVTEWLPFSISAVAEETYNSFALLAESKNKQFTADIQPNLTFNGNESQLRQLISILCDNAVKYASDNGSIHLTLDQKGKTIFLCVKNTCASIPEGDMNRLFDRFYRPESSRSRETGGYGIGLSIAQAIVHSHKGKITVQKEADNVIGFHVIL